jgi:hypothetical protein
MAAEHGESAPLMFLRYLRNTVAWINAMNYIFHGIKSSRSFNDITLDFATTPLASPDECAPEGPFVDSAITYMLKKLGSDPQSEKAKDLIEEFKKTVLPVAFRGTVHCEASLMGMIVACKENTMPLPTGVRRKELEVFKVMWQLISYRLVSLRHSIIECGDRRWCGCDRGWEEVLLVLFSTCQAVEHRASAHISPGSSISWTGVPVGIAHYWNLSGHCGIPGDGPEGGMAPASRKIC